MARAPKKKRRTRYLSPGRKMLLVAALLAVFALSSTLFLNFRAHRSEEGPENGEGFADPIQAYVMVGEGELTAPFYNEGFAVVDQFGRGTQVQLESWEPFLTESNEEYYHIYYNGRTGYIPCANITDDQSELMQETQLYVRTPVNLLQDTDSIELGSLVQKGTLLRVVGYDFFKPDGTVNKYHVKMGDEFGWIKSEYVVLDYGDAMDVWIGADGYDIHEYRGEASWGGGNAGGLDYWAHDKGDFADEGNVMPENVYALYIAASQATMDMVDDYLDLAKDTAINAFVITLNDGVEMAYESDWVAQYGIMDEYHPFNTVEGFAEVVKTLRDAGYYVIGRVTTFRDDPLANARPEWAITDASGLPKTMSGSSWPSPFCRDVWKMKVGFAAEAADLFDLNEIQFDYVRFPDYIQDNQKEGFLDLKNVLGESMAQAIQRFLTYACDVLHEHGVYVGADVFGEVANDYVAPYGQYWPAISTVVDVISGMPYPDHFDRYQENARWVIPYKRPYLMLHNWSLHVFDRQQECASPAVVRTWLQTCDDSDYKYNGAAIQREILGTYDADVPGGYMLWYGNGSLGVAENLKGAIEYDYGALYKEAKAQNMMLSEYMGVSTDDTQ